MLQPSLRGGGPNFFSLLKPKFRIELNANEIERLSVEKRPEIKDFFAALYEDPNFNTGPPLSFYDILVKGTIDAIKREDPSKFQLSPKNFKKYLNHLIPLIEGKIIRANLKSSLTLTLARDTSSIEEIVAQIMISIFNERSEPFIGMGSRGSRTEIIRETLARRDSGEITNSRKDLRELVPPVQRNLKPFLHRFFLNLLIRDMFPFEDLDNTSLYGKMADKLARLCVQAETKSTTRSPLLPVLKLPWKQAILEVQRYQLRKIPWEDYDTLLLVKHYNLITDFGRSVPDDPKDLENKNKIEELIRGCLHVYREQEDSLTAEEFGELMALGGIKQRPASPLEKSFFQKLLSQVLLDMSNDPLFEALKVEALATLMLQVLEDHEGVLCSNDDVKKCLEILHIQVGHLLFTSENPNMQRCMDALNLVLEVMARKQVTGFHSDECGRLQSTLNNHIPTASKRAFQMLKGGTNPSLKFKAQYALEALKRIGGEETGLSPEENALVKGAPAAMNIAKGIFKFDTQAVIEGTKQLTAIGKEYMDTIPKRWMDDVVTMNGLAASNFEEFKRFFIKRLNAPKPPAHLSEFLFFLIENLHKIARDRKRPYSERRQSVELMQDLHQNLSDKKILDKRDFELLIQIHMSDLSNMPQEEQFVYETQINETARVYLMNYALDVLSVPTFCFSDISLPSSNSLFKSALRLHNSLDCAVSELQKSCSEHYDHEIASLHLIDIEGDHYYNGTKPSPPVHYTLCRERAVKDILLKTKGEPAHKSTALLSFLYDPARVWLIQGDAGTGKSILLKIIEKSVWSLYAHGTSQYIPIFIRLAEVKNANRCIDEMLQARHYPKRTIQEMKIHGREGRRKYLFIFDGFDELKAPKNLFKENKLEEFGSDSKLILTCREEYLKAYGAYMKYFKPSAKEPLFESRITDVTPEQRRVYLEKSVIHNKKMLLTLDQETEQDEISWRSRWNSVEAYEEIIESIHGLKELIKTPYMLRIIIDILPILTSRKTTSVTKSKIYKTFTLYHFEKEANRLLERMSDQIPRGFDLERSFYAFSKDLAVSMWLQNRTSVTTESGDYIQRKEVYLQMVSATTNSSPQPPKQMEDDSDPLSFSRFFNSDPKTQFARAGAQLTIVDNEARFTHKSIMEYFVARFFYEELKYLHTYKEMLNLKSLTGSGELDQESDILYFLVDMMIDNHDQQEALKEGTQEETGAHVMENLAILLQKHQQELVVPKEKWQQNLILISTGHPAPPSKELCKALAELFKVRANSNLLSPEQQEKSRQLYQHYLQLVVNCNLGGAYQGETISDPQTGLLIAQGQGKLVYPDGSFYEGTFVNGVREGRGRYQDIQGFVYDGEWRSDLKEGGGKLHLPPDERWKEGSLYIGVWRKGELIEGMLKLKSGACAKCLFTERGFQLPISELTRLCEQNKAENAKEIISCMSNQTELRQELEKTESGKRILATVGIRKYPADSFGPYEWNTFLGSVSLDNVPPLPPNIEQILEDECPFFTDPKKGGRKIRETHQLVYIPDRVNGELFNLDSLRHLVEKPKLGRKGTFREYDEGIKSLFGKRVATPHWVLMTRSIIPRSEGKPVEEMKKMVTTLSQMTSMPYEMPTALEVATCLFTQYIYSGTSLLAEEYTVCHESNSKSSAFLGDEGHFSVGIGQFEKGGIGIIKIFGKKTPKKKKLIPENYSLGVCVHLKFDH